MTLDDSYITDPDYTYTCELCCVIDGDTLELRIDLGFRIWIKLTIQLQDFNAPKSKEKEFKTKAEEWFMNHPGPFYVTTTKPITEGWNRQHFESAGWLGRVFVNLPEIDRRSAREYLSDHQRIEWRHSDGIK